MFNTLAFYILLTISGQKIFFSTYFIFLFIFFFFPWNLQFSTIHYKIINDIKGELSYIMQWCNFIQLFAISLTPSHIIRKKPNEI